MLATFYETQEENAQIFQNPQIFFDILLEVSLRKLCLFKQTSYIPLTADDNWTVSMAKEPT